jgi:hypothetical protein
MTTTRNTITINIVNEGSGPAASGTLVTSRVIDLEDLDERYCLLYLKLEDPTDDHTLPLTVVDMLETSVPVDFVAIEESVRKAAREARKAAREALAAQNQ